jgi:hypothetical protein
LLEVGFDFVLVAFKSFFEALELRPIGGEADAKDTNPGFGLRFTFIHGHLLVFANSGR